MHITCILYAFYMHYFSIFVHFINWLFTYYHCYSAQFTFDKDAQVCNDYGNWYFNILYFILLQHGKVEFINGYLLSCLWLLRFTWVYIIIITSVYISWCMGINLMVLYMLTLDIWNISFHKINIHWSTNGCWFNGIKWMIWYLNTGNNK